MSNNITKVEISRALHNFGGSVYICPKCFNTIDIRSNPKTIELNIMGDKNKEASLECVKLDCHVKCIECDEYMFEANPGIAKYIPVLNKYGIKTLYSCQGHRQFNQNIFTQADMGTIDLFPYIKFTTDGDMDLLNIIKDVIKDEEYVYLEVDSYESFCYYLYGGRNNIKFCIEYLKNERAMIYEINMACMRFRIVLNNICNRLARGEY